jgi:predicted dithiol-disulfide oxidoreductase (DUF899 family)
MGVTFPNETPEYRSARAALLKREVELRREMEAVAAQLRVLPPGGELPEDYLFECIGADGAPSTVRLSTLFHGGDTLMLYHFMFPRHAEDRRPGPTTGAMAQVPLAEGPCPSCTALIDMWEGEVVTSNLNVPKGELRCTSVPGYQLDLGAMASDALRRELGSARAVVALLTPEQPR